MGTQEIIDLKPLSHEPEFDTFDEATVEHSRTRQAQLDSTLVQKEIIISIVSSVDQCTLFLSNGASLRFYIDHGIVVWCIANLDSSVSDVNKTESYLLQFQGADIPYHWKKGEFLNSFLGKEIVLLAAAHTWIFLTLAGVGEIMFSASENINNGRDFLFFDLS